MIIFTRLTNQWRGHCISLLAYALDILSVILISNILSETRIEEISLSSVVSTLALIILMRLVSLLVLKKWAYTEFYNYKTTENRNLIKTTLNSIRQNQKNDIDITREKILYSSEISIVNFDVPVSLLIGEVIVLIISTLYILKIIDVTPVLIPAAIIFATIFTLYLYLIVLVAKLGRQQIKFQKYKISWISNVLNIAQTLALNNASRYAIKTHSNNELNCNRTTVGLMVINQLTTLLIEFMMLVIGVLVIISAQDFDQLIALTPLAARIAPSISKIAAYASQLAFGIQAVRNVA